MRLNQLGYIVHACWSELSLHYPKVTLDCFIVMPNHIHGIIFLRGATGAGFKPAPTRDAAPVTEAVRAFKTFSARRVNSVLHRTGAVWQRNYYERVVRNDRELNAIREYIVNNPARWEFDRENPQRRPEPVPA
jgi:REP element-mobilizing transposase RayT